MHAPSPKHLTIEELLPAPWRLGEPDTVGRLTVFPLLGGPAEHDPGYVTFSRATGSGVVARELPTGPAVSHIVVHNPTGSMVLLLDGEEVLGAQQNRVFDGSVLVPARSEARVAVCCVEKGRWDGARRGEAFRSSPQVSAPGLRRTLASSRDASGSGRARQHEVWTHVSEMVERTGTVTGTEAMSAVYERRGEDLRRAEERILLREHQRGAVAFVAGRFVALDWLASAEAWAELHRRVVRGYALELASTERDGATPAAHEAAALVAHLAAMPVELGAQAGLGQRLRPAQGASSRWRVSSLLHDGKLVQLSVLAAA